MNEETRKKFQEHAEEALEEQKQKTKDYAFKVIPTGLWAAAVVFTSATTFNSGESFPIICGVVSIIGAIITVVKVYKKYV